MGRRGILDNFGGPIPQGLPRETFELQAATLVLKNRRGVNSANLVVTTNGELRTNRKQSHSTNWQCVKKSAENYVQRMIDSDHAETVCVACR